MNEGGGEAVMSSVESAVESAVCKASNWSGMTAVCSNISISCDEKAYAHVVGAATRTQRSRGHDVILRSARRYCYVSIL